MKERIMEIIYEKRSFANITGGVNNELINKLQENLEVELPKSYKWFLENYGHILIMGEEIYGIQQGGISSCLNATKRYRKIGLPKQYVVIQSCDEWIFCLDTEGMIKNECPVIEWSRTEGVGIDEFDNFYIFLLNRLEEALENWE